MQAACATKTTAFFAAAKCSLHGAVVFTVCLFQFGFRKWKGNVTEKPIEDRSDIDKELHTDLSIVKQQGGLFLTTFFIIC